MPIETIDRVGKLIRDYREQAGLTQAELAERAGFGLTTLNRWENGASTGRYPGVKDLIQILDALNRSIVEFAMDLDPASGSRPQITEKRAEATEALVRINKTLARLLESTSDLSRALNG